MKILIVPVISLIMSAFWFAPWIGDPRSGLSFYVLAFFWFFIAWIIALGYCVKAFKLRKTDSGAKTMYWIGASIIFISYFIVWAGAVKGYMVTV